MVMGLRNESGFTTFEGNGKGIKATWSRRFKSSGRYKKAIKDRLKPA